MGMTMASHRKPRNRRYRKARPSGRPNGNRKHAELESRIAASSQDDGPFRMCHSSDGRTKRRFLSRADAKAHLKSRPDLVGMNVYRCTVCGYLHIGHKRQSVS